MVRSIAFVAGAVALGLGGVALAQPRLIVDPWAPAANRASASLAPAEVRSPKLRPNDPANSPSDAHAISRIASGLGDEAKAVPKPAATRAKRVASWSARFNEIVDPWQQAPQFTADYGAKLIVDPWAPSVRPTQQETPK